MQTKGRIYRARSARPGLERLATVRRVVSDVGAIVAVLASVTLFGMALLIILRWL